ncbi:hypothetical protein [Bacillus thuringiensis]|uniref:hypothetical protein n=1 Tax=Bacillus thuringiensis TaxID=1428 RepID=UPI00300E5469
MKNSQQTVVNSKGREKWIDVNKGIIGYINPFTFSELSYSKDTENNSPFIGTLGKGTKIQVFEENDYKPELAPKKANIERIQREGKNLIVMSYEV